MTNKTVHEVLIGQTETGFVAISVDAPFFCFEAESEAAVEQKAKSAIAFYAKHKASPAPVASGKKRTVSTFIPWKTVALNDMVAA